MNNAHRTRPMKWAPAAALSRAPLVVRQFLTFGVIGTAAFVIDATLLTLLVHKMGLGLYSGRAISFLCGASFTWALNRRFTFASRPNESRATQWLRFLATNAVGAMVNLGTYVW